MEPIDEIVSPVERIRSTLNYCLLSLVAGDHLVTEDSLPQYLTDRFDKYAHICPSKFQRALF
jgi:hypothetical protein